MRLLTLRCASRIAGPLDRIIEPTLAGFQRKWLAVGMVREVAATSAQLENFTRQCRLGHDGTMPGKCRVTSKPNPRKSQIIQYFAGVVQW
jgi:hypothetical protein